MTGIGRVLRTLASGGGKLPIAALLLLVLPFAFPSLTLIKRLDDGLSEWRSSQAPRPASGKFAFLAIDKKSLDAIGVWPWPRNIYADAIDKAVSAGVHDIFIDIDFSARSTPSADERLAKALADAGGAVILPIFRQHHGADRTGEAISLSEPLPLFSRNAWLATANVRLDADALVRNFAAAEDINGTVVQSAPAVLAGAAADTTGEVVIDFSISPQTIPVYSIADFLSGAIAASALEGKSIVIGAFATELKDIFPVPVHGLVSGPMLHVLAAETLVQQRSLRTVDPTPLAILSGLGLILMLAFSRRIPLKAAVICLLAMAAALEAAAFFLQMNMAVVLPTALLHLMAAAGITLLFLFELDLSYWLARIARIETRNSERILGQIIMDSADAVIVVDQALKVVKVSQTTRSMLGQRPLLADAGFLQGAPAELAEIVTNALEQYRSDGTANFEPVEFHLIVDGAPRILECRLTISTLEQDTGERGSDAPFAVCITLRDMTTRRSYEDKLKYLSEYDELTGTLHRGALVRRMEQHTDTPWTVCVINLHRFAVVNSTLGRDVGDELLKAFADRLRHVDPSVLYVSRLGSDVFCIALKFGASHGTIEDFAAKLIASLSGAFFLENSIVDVSARVGICADLSSRMRPVQLIDSAEIALEDAPQARRLRLHDLQSGLRRKTFAAAPARGRSSRGAAARPVLPAVPASGGAFERQAHRCGGAGAMEASAFGHGLAARIHQRRGSQWFHNGTRALGSR